MGQFKPFSRGFSLAVRRPAPPLNEAQEPLLADADEDADEHADADGLYPPHSCWTSDDPHPPEPHAHLPVYRTIHQYAMLFSFSWLGLLS